MLKLITFNSLIAILLVSCVSTQKLSENITGKYLQEGNENISLTFSGTTFAFTDPYVTDQALFTCCDTITYGKWEKLNDLIVLSTPELNVSKISLDVEEKIDAAFPDTLYFSMNNQIEKYYKRVGVTEGERDIFYKIFIKAKDSYFYTRISGKKYFSGTVKVYKPKNISIDEFSVLIYPTANFGGRNTGIKEVQTQSYKVSQNESNVFILNIPELSYEFMSYLRLNRDFIRIISKTKLEWDGKYFRKADTN